MEGMTLSRRKNGQQTVPQAKCLILNKLNQSALISFGNAFLVQLTWWLLNLLQMLKKTYMRNLLCLQHYLLPCTGDIWSKVYGSLL